MTTFAIPQGLWFRMADLIQDMGNHHPQYRETDAGRDLAVLGDAIKYGVPAYEGAPVDHNQEEHLTKARAIIAKHGGGDPRHSVIEQSISTAEKLLGLWVD